MTPPDYDPGPGFPQTRANAIAIEKAFVAARPGKVVFLSTVGAQVAEPNLLNNSKMTEETLRQLPMPVAFLRAGSFMENAAWDVEAARNGVVPSLLQPLDHVIPMVATADIGHTAAACFRKTGPACGSLSLQDRVVTPPPISDAPLPPLSAARSAWSRFRARPGISFSARKARRTPCHASAWSMASTKAGSTSSVPANTAGAPSPSIP